MEYWFKNIFAEFTHVWDVLRSDLQISLVLEVNTAHLFCCSCNIINNNNNCSWILVVWSLPSVSFLARHQRQHDGMPALHINWYVTAKNQNILENNGQATACLPDYKKIKTNLCHCQYLCLCVSLCECVLDREGSGVLLVQLQYKVVVALCTALHLRCFPEVLSPPYSSVSVTSVWNIYDHCKWQLHVMAPNVLVITYFSDYFDYCFCLTEYETMGLGVWNRKPRTVVLVCCKLAPQKGSPDSFRLFHAIAISYLNKWIGGTVALDIMTVTIMKFFSVLLQNIIFFALCHVCRCHMLSQLIPKAHVCGVWFNWCRIN